MIALTATLAAMQKKCTGRNHMKGIIPMPESSDLSLMTDRVGKGWFSTLCDGSELIGSGITRFCMPAALLLIGLGACTMERQAQADNGMSFFITSVGAGQGA